MTRTEVLKAANGARMAILAVVASMALTAAFADTATCIVTPGWDIGYASTNTCSSVASSPVAMETGTLSGHATAASVVEARYRTWFESEGIGLNATKFHPLVIIVL